MSRNETVWLIDMRYVSQGRLEKRSPRAALEDCEHTKIHQDSRALQISTNDLRMMRSDNTVTQESRHRTMSGVSSQVLASKLGTVQDDCTPTAAIKQAHERISYARSRCVLSVRTLKTSMQHVATCT